MSSEFHEGLMRVHAGRDTFDEFARATVKHWEKLAAYIARRWRLPIWATTEDVRQDLLFAAWKGIWEWDPTRGVPIGSYVVYYAVDKAKKRAHCYRNAKRSGNADANPPRFERAATAAWGEDAERISETKLQVEATQVEDLERGELHGRVLKLCRTVEERHFVLQAMAAEQFDEAISGEPSALVETAVRVYSNLATRRLCAVRTEEDALRMVVWASARVATRVVEMARAA